MINSNLQTTVVFGGAHGGAATYSPEAKQLYSNVLGVKKASISLIHSVATMLEAEVKKSKLNPLIIKKTEVLNIMRKPEAEHETEQRVK